MDWSSWWAGRPDRWPVLGTAGFRGYLHGPRGAVVGGVLDGAGAAASLALEPFPQRAGTAAALLGAIQLGGGASLATLLLITPLAPQTSLALICCGGGLALWAIGRGLADTAAGE
ncbi:hypothetical protein [Salinicola acroporae]|uniref:hypothetical protein n=1 Tax=Salinicola acroporae TaxID=1541440 RepID=UPI00245524F1|nr:hypothetical protein [Salinicola acroporae]